MKLRIGAVLVGVLADPAQRALHVDDVRGERGLRREAVVDREADPAAAREVSHQRAALLALVADHPAAAVDLHEDRTAGAGLLGQHDVEQVAPALVARQRLAVGHVQDPPHAGALHLERTQEAVRARHVAVVDRESGRARELFDLALGALRAEVAREQEPPRREREREAHQAARLVERAERRERRA